MGDQTIEITDPNVSEGVDNEPVGARINYAVDPIRTPVEDACQVKFTTWPDNGTTITNEGLAGAAYDGVAADNDYALQATGATSFVFDTSTDKVTIPHGAAVDNLGAHTIEFGYYYGVDSSTPMYFNKTRYQVFNHVYYHRLSIRRYISDGVSYREWHTPSNSLLIGGYYHVQITWDEGVLTTPTIKINGVTQTLAMMLNPTIISWYDDSTYNLDFGSFNTSGTTFYFWKLHNRVLSDEELTRNYNAEKWRFFTPLPYETGCTVKYDFTEPSGNFINKVDPATESLAITSAPVRSQLPSGAYNSYWDGSNDIGTADSLTLSNNLTVEVIYRPYSTSTTYDLFSQYTSAVGGFKVLQVGTNRAAFYILSGAYSLATASNALDLTRYNHVAFTVSQSGNNSVVSSYINGVFSTTGSLAALIGTTGASLLVAQVVANARYKGDIALIRIYNGTVLTPAQIQQNYEAEKWRYQTPIVNAQDTLNVVPVGDQTRTCVENYQDTTNNEGVGARIASPLQTLPAVVEDVCQVKFTTWPVAGNTIVNEGLAGASYNGVALDNDYFLQPSGATSFKFDDTTDTITVTAGAAINNLTTMTFEFGIHIATAHTGQTMLFEKIRASDKFWVMLISGGIYIRRRNYVDYTTNYKYYRFPVVSPTTGVHHIQITWDSTDVNNIPIVRYNGVIKTLTSNMSVGTVTQWYDDSAGNMCAYRPASDKLVGELIFWKLHNRVLTDTELLQNYNYERWRGYMVGSWAANSETTDIEGVGAQTLAASDINFSETVDYEPVGAQARTVETTSSDIVDHEPVGAQTLTELDTNFTEIILEDGSVIRIPTRRITATIDKRDDFASNVKTEQDIASSVETEQDITATMEIET